MSSLGEPEFQAWNVSEGQFPKEGTKDEQLKFPIKLCYPCLGFSSSYF